MSVSRETKLVALGAGSVAAAAGAALLVRHALRKPAAAAKVGAAAGAVPEAPSSRWTEQQVADWLLRLGVGERTAAVFRGEMITGDRLLELSDQDIVLLSATASDAERILTAVRAAPKPGALEQFLKETQAMFVSLAAGTPSTPAERAKQLHGVLYAFKSFQLLPADAQASALLPLSRQVTAALALVQQAAESGASLPPRDAAAGPEGTGMSPERLQSTVHQLDEMLDKFLMVARVGLAQMPEDKAHDLKQRLLEQAARVEEISQSMPNSVGAPLKQKCAELRAALNRGPADGSTAVDGSEEVSMPQLVLRVKELFMALKDGEVTAMPPDARSKKLQDIREELHYIQEAANSQPESEHRTLVLSASKTVSHLAEQMQVALGESGLPQKGAGEVTYRQGENDENEEDGSLQGTVSGLSRIVDYLNSSEFDAVPLDRRDAVVMVVAQDIERLRGQVEASEEPGKEEVMQQLVLPLQSLVISFQSASANEEPSGSFEEVRSLLRDIYSVVTSSDLEGQPQEAKDRIANAVRHQLVRIGSSLDTLSSTEKAAAEELILGINTALNQYAGSGEVSDASAASQRILGRVEDVMNTIQKPEFNTATAEERAQTINDALMTLVMSRNEAVELGAMGRPLVVFIDDMVPSLEAMAENQQGEGDEENEVEARRKVFTALTSLAGELESRNAATQGVSPSELDHFHRIRDATNTMPHKTEEERATLQRFDHALTAAGSQTQMDSASVVSFVQTLNKIKERVQVCQTTAQLRPLLQMMERVIAAADRCDVPWRENQEAAAAVAGLLEQIQHFQASHPEEDNTSVRERIEASLASIKSRPPQTMEDLLPYYEVLRHACASGVEETMECVEELQQAIREAVERVQQQGASKELVSNLLEMSNALKEEDLPESVLAAFETTLDDVAAKPLTPEVSSAVATIREQIKLQRVRHAQDSCDVDSEETHAEDDEADEPGKDSETSKEPSPHTGSSGSPPGSVETPQSPVESAKRPAADDPSATAVEVSQHERETIERYISLFPRIESHAALPAEKFHSTITPFDLSFIKSVLRRLSSSPLVTDEALKQRINVTKERLEMLLGEEAKDEAPAPNAAKASAPAVPLHVAAHETQNAAGDKNVHFVIHTSEESGEHPKNNKLMKKLNREAQSSEQPSASDKSKWNGQSLAILLNDPNNNQDEMRSVGNELSVLDDALVNNGFSVVHASPALNRREDFEELLRGAMEAHPSRLFVYNCSGKDSDEPDKLTFGDGSSMQLGDVMDLTAPAERAVVASCHPNRLDMNYRHDEHMGPAVAVHLSPKAAESLQGRRCAIFDGIFTPIVADFLGADHGNATMCPEDLMRRIVSEASSTDFTEEYLCDVSSSPLITDLFVLFNIIIITISILIYCAVIDVHMCATLLSFIICYLTWFLTSLNSRTKWIRKRIIDSYCSKKPKNSNTNNKKVNKNMITNSHPIYARANRLSYPRTPSSAIYRYQHQTHPNSSSSLSLLFIHSPALILRNEILNFSLRQQTETTTFR
eukprot:gene2350-1479_t